MLDNEKINRFIEDALNEIREIDERYEQCKALCDKLPQTALSPEVEAKVQQLLDKARAEAEAAGQRRRQTVDLTSPAAPKRSGSRRRTLI